MDSRSFFSVSFLGFICVVGCFDSLMDNVYFDIKWPGPEESLQMAEENKNHLGEDGSVLVMTNNKEKYRCVIPTVLESDHKETDEMVPDALELDLLKPLFDQNVCTYRLETYWTYELCHGRHLRQYHEEKEMGKKPKLQEYFLGRYNMETFNSDYETAKQNQLKSDKKQNASRKIQKVQGIEIPYYEVVYTDGTLCELTGQPRKSFLHYVCQPDGRGEIYELKETSSCEYEVVVLANQLCAHPAYGPKTEHTNTIHCHALEGSPKRPQNLDLFNLESTFEQFNGKQFWDDDSSEKEDLDPINSLWDLVGKIMKELEPTQQPDVSQSQTPTQRPQSEPTQGATLRHPPANNLIQKEFFEGSFCIEGGAGWWKHKFCYGKHVMQFHVDAARRDFIVLGEWNEDAHLRWISANSWKRPRQLSERKYISQFYSDGDVCEITGKRRSVEVKLRCISNPEHPNSVAIFLSEPRTCEYLLVVESPILCDLIAQADDNGLIVNPKL